MAHLRREDLQIKVPALLYLSRLGYQYLTGTQLRSRDRNTNILTDTLRETAERINGTRLTPEDFGRLTGDLQSQLDADDLGKQFYGTIRNGWNGLRLIDYEHPENNSFLFHYAYAALDYCLFELHVWYTVHKQTARTVGALEYSHAVAAAIELVSCCKTCRAAADYGNGFSGTGRNRTSMRIAFGIGALDNGIFIFPYCYCISQCTAGASLFAQCRTDARGKFREIIGYSESFIRKLPCSAIDEVVPFGDKVIKRTSGDHAADRHTCLTEGDAAVHAACRLLTAILFTKRRMEFIIVKNSLFFLLCRRILSFIFQKSCWLSHCCSSLFLSRQAVKGFNSCLLCGKSLALKLCDFRSDLLVVVGDYFLEFMQILCKA